MHKTEIKKTHKLECDFCGKKLEFEITKENYDKPYPYKAIWISDEGTDVMVEDRPWGIGDRESNFKDACPKCYEGLKMLNKIFVGVVKSMLVK